MDAKFRQSGKPIAARVLDPSLQSLVSFDAYFNHTLFHELSHGLGPGFLTQADGKRVEVRIPQGNETEDDKNRFGPAESVTLSSAEP